jgi:hypothetical protein
VNFVGFLIIIFEEIILPKDKNSQNLERVNIHHHGCNPWLQNKKWVGPQRDLINNHKIINLGLALYTTANRADSRCWGFTTFSTI